MNLAAIVTKIEALGLGQGGQDIFVDQMESSVVNGILVRTPLTGIDIDHELPNYYRGALQVIVRSAQHAPGKAKADALVSGLSIYETDLLDSNGKGMRMKRMLPKTLPIVYRRSDGNGIEFSVNFDVAYTMID